MSRFIVNPDYYTVEPLSEDPIITGQLARVKKLDITYIDINANYKVDTKGLIVYDTDVVKMQIANIFATPLGSDPFEPTYGSNLPYRLYDPITTVTAFLIFNDTIGALTKWMQNLGRIQLNPNLCYVRPIDNDVDNEGYEVQMVYSIVRSQVLSQFNAVVLR